MTASNLTRIAVILDRSGSMQSIHKATIEGFNEFVGKLKSEPSEASLKLIEFDDKYETVFDTPLFRTRLLTPQDCLPRGLTALNDAIGTTIADLGKELSAIPGAERPDKVIVMIMTDGQENASRGYSPNQVARMIQHQKDHYNWEFLYLGANQDAVKVASRMNIDRDSSLTYAANYAGTTYSMNAAANHINMTRSSVKYYDKAFSGGIISPAAFTDQDRQNALVNTDWTGVIPGSGALSQTGDQTEGALSNLATNLVPAGGGEAPNSPGR